MANHHAVLPAAARRGAEGWTDDRVAMLTKLWADGRSASQIAKQMGGVTRAAVIGKARRLSLPGRATPSKPTREKAPAQTVRRTRSEAGKVNAHPGGRPKVFRLVPGNPVEGSKPVPIKAASFEVLPGTNPKHWTERKFGECSWPVSGEGADTMSCCAVVERGGVCAQHARLAFSAKPVATAKELSRSLRRYV